MNIKERAERLFSWAEKQYLGDHVDTWRSHSMNVARAAETIAIAVREQELKQGINPTIDPDRAYSCGYLHDLGRSAGEHVGLEHPIIGYHLLRDHGFPLEAQISMTHGYYAYKKIDRSEYWEEFIDAELLHFTRDYLENVELTDYDYLIQLCDNMAHHSGIMTIDGRFADILVRHDNIRNAGTHLKELYKLKKYFDNKAGLNIYDLFKDEIIRATLEK